MPERSCFSTLPCTGKRFPLRISLSISSLGRQENRRPPKLAKDSMIARACFALSFLVAILSGIAAANAQNCTSADFGAVVDQTAQALRELNVSSSKRYQTKVAALREKNRLSEADLEARTSGLHDEKIDGFNREVESLVAQMDVLSQTPSSKITCDKLDELKRVRDRLLAVMGQKSSYMLAKIDTELDNPGGKPAPQIATSSNQWAAVPEPGRAEPQGAPSSIKPPSIAEQKPRATEPGLPPVASARPAPGTPDYAPPALPERSPGAPARIARNTLPPERDLPPPPPISDANRPTALAPPPPMSDANRPATLAPPPRGEGASPLAAPPLPPPVAQEGYSISDIREAGRGVFGTVTAEFGAAINYAFQQFGQPNAYISGVEGGGAFLAGLRYGKGTLYRKTVAPSEIYWQGPSAGIDFGAEGGRALFLVYNLDDPYAIYGRFGGIGGAAYVAGGVGLNVLGKGGVVIVPIRSGLGLRLGANLAYVKFTERQTWNPF
jgi:hypothetical protein